MFQFAVEEGYTNNADYKSLHKVGCRDLRDGETVTITGDSTDRALILDVLTSYAYDDYTWEDILAQTQPCIRQQFTSIKE